MRFRAACFYRRSNLGEIHVGVPLLLSSLTAQAPKLYQSLTNLEVIVAVLVGSSPLGESAQRRS